MVFFSELGAGITRRNIFDIWKEQQVPGLKVQAVVNFISNLRDFRGYENVVQSKIKKAIKNLCAIFRLKWTKCHRNEKLFLASNEAWLLGKTRFGVEPKKVSPGRPAKNFEDCTESAKRKKVRKLVTSASKQELAYATRLSMHASGQRHAADIVKQVSTCSPERATRLKKNLRMNTKLPKKMTPDQALAIFVDTKMTKTQYNRIKENSKQFNADIYPNYNKLLEAKKGCYPAGILTDEITAEVPLQGLVDHTLNRLAIAQVEVLNHIDQNHTISSIQAWFKWGCDGAAGQSRYKQRFTNKDDDDSFLFSISMVPLRIIVQNDKHEEIIVFQNPTTSSTNYCRPIKIIFKQEKEAFVKHEIQNIKNQIALLQPSPIKIGEYVYNCTCVLSLTMIDGKICSWLAKSSSQNCHLCYATPSLMNNIQEVKARQVLAENVEFGVSSLHAWIKCFECLLHISYRMDIKKWSVRNADKAAFNVRKKLVQERFRREMGLLVDIPKPGFGTTNDGNSARQFFRHPSIAAAITGIDEALIKRFHIVLTTIACGHEVDSEKFQKYCLNTAELYVSLYPWYYMPQSVHKILIHGGILVNSSILPIGQMSEEAQEARNKDSKHIREHHSRKFSRQQTMEDMIHMLLISSDPYITSIRKPIKRNNKNLPQEVITMLKTPQEPRSSQSNHEFSDESD